MPVVFADAPGGSQVPDTVIEAIAGRYRRGASNMHGAFVTSREIEETVAAARRAGADLMGTDPDRDRLRAELHDAALQLSPGRSAGRSAPATRSSSRRSTTTRTSGRGCWRPRTPAPTVRWVDVRDDDVTLDLDSFDAR